MSAPSPVTPDPLLGAWIAGRYRVTALIARGGAAAVYRAEASAGGIVAIKVLHPGEDPRRIVREAEVGRQLTHPNTVRMLEHGHGEGRAWLVMEHLAGRNLYQVLSTDAPMDPVRVTRIARELAGALDEAHAKGFVHGDLKPANVLLTDRESVKLLDFGLAETTGSARHGFAGSPAYASPEQIRGEPLDARSDIYALGALIYTCLTGRPPFSGANAEIVFDGHLHASPPSLREACPSMPGAPVLERVIRRCLRKGRADRYASMAALAADLPWTR